MNIIQQQKREAWSLRCLRKYYSYHYKEYTERMLFEEQRVPNIRCIEDINEKLKKHGVFFDQTKINDRFSKRSKKDLNAIDKLKSYGVHEPVMF